MDELKLKLSTKFMRNLVAKLITKIIQKKLGYKVKIQLNELEVNVIDGDAVVLANVEAKMDNKEFMKLLLNIDEEEN